MLVDVKDLIDAMGLTASLEADLTVTLTSVIQRAELRVESEIGSPLTKHSGTDLFRPDPDLFCGIVPPSGLRLRLSRKFPVSTQDDPLMITANGKVLPSTEVFLDPDSAFVDIPSDYALQNIVVDYTSGFSPGEALPPRLKQAILGFATSIAATNQTGESGASQQNSLRAGDVAQGHLVWYARPVPFSYSAMRATSNASI